MGKCWLKRIEADGENRGNGKAKSQLTELAPRIRKRQIGIRVDFLSLNLILYLESPSMVMNLAYA
jgi:hypothetical protein